MNPEARLVVVAYKPKEGMQERLLELTRLHVPLLREEKLATDRPAVAGVSNGGTVVEVFEWVVGGVAAAHTNTRVLEMWKEYAEVCEIIPLSQVPEASNMFAGFVPIDL